jgi:anaerobic magnesium-protoporphyrin IX monomethyl ester cyclase
MTFKVALLRLPGTYADWFRRPILGITYLAARLGQAGIETRIFDAYFHGWSMDELEQRVIDYGPDLFGVTAMTHEISRAAEPAQKIKAKCDVPALVGGAHVTALPLDTLIQYPMFDYGVFGEGETTVLGLVSVLRNGPNPDRLSAIAGLVYRRNDEVFRNSHRDFLSAVDLDDLPFPDFSSYYGDNPSALAGRHQYYPLISSRGCPYNCAFCMQVLGRRVRAWSPENVLAEIEHAVSKYGAHTIDFQDEIFLADNQRTRRILELMISTGLNRRIRWRGLTRVNMVTESIIDLAKKAGCHHLEMGVESGNDDILADIGKGITVSQVEQTAAIIKKAGLELVTYYIIGHPNETPETARQTVDLAVRLNTHGIAVGLMVRTRALAYTIWPDRARPGTGC